MKKTVLITGSSRGLGRSLALAFASRGCAVVLSGRDRKRLNSVKEEVLKHDVQCRIVIGDISKEKTITALTDAAKEAKVTTLINNAGIYLQKRLEDMSPEEFRRVIDVNLVAPVLLTKNIYLLFRKRGGGTIININSIAGKSFGENESAYSASKHGLRGFMGSFKYEALKHNVTVIDMFFGAMDTDMTAGRKDTGKFIRTKEAAELICRAAEDTVSLRINEIDVLRKIY